VKTVEAKMAKEAFKQYGMPEPEELGPNGEESFEREYTPAFLARQDLFKLRLAQVQLASRAGSSLPRESAGSWVAEYIRARQQQATTLAQALSSKLTKKAQVLGVSVR